MSVDIFGQIFGFLAYRFLDDRLSGPFESLEEYYSVKMNTSQFYHILIDLNDF